MLSARFICKRRDNENTEMPHLELQIASARFLEEILENLNEENCVA